MKIFTLKCILFLYCKRRKRFVACFDFYRLNTFKNKVMHIILEVFKSIIYILQNTMHKFAAFFLFIP